MWLAFGSLRNMSAYFRGSFIVAEPDVCEVGPVELDKEYTAKFTLRNITSEPVVVLGAQTCCGCRLRSSMPHTINPNGSSEIEFTVKIGASQSIRAFTRRFLLLIDKGGGFGPMLTIHVNVVEASRVSVVRPRETEVFTPCVAGVWRQPTESPFPHLD